MGFWTLGQHHEHHIARAVAGRNAAIVSLADRVAQLQKLQISMVSTSHTYMRGMQTSLNGAGARTKHCFTFMCRIRTAPVACSHIP